MNIKNSNEKFDWDLEYPVQIKLEGGTLTTVNSLSEIEEHQIDESIYENLNSSMYDNTRYDSSIYDNGIYSNEYV